VQTLEFAGEQPLEADAVFFDKIRQLLGHDALYLRYLIGQLPFVSQPSQAVAYPFGRARAVRGQTPLGGLPALRSAESLVAFASDAELCERLGFPWPARASTAFPAAAFIKSSTWPIT
jgi:hypothetical protein